MNNHHDHVHIDVKAKENSHESSMNSPMTVKIHMLNYKTHKMKMATYTEDVSLTRSKTGNQELDDAKNHRQTKEAEQLNQVHLHPDLSLPYAAILLSADSDDDEVNMY